MNWIRRIEVRGSQGDLWVVAIADTGMWGCSCPKWRFAKKDHSTGTRPDCHHITGVKAALSAKGAAIPRVNREVVLASVQVRVAPAATVLSNPAPQSRFAGLEMGELPAVAALQTGERFRHLDLDMLVTI